MSIVMRLIALFKNRGVILTPEEEDILRILKIPNIKSLLYEACYLDKYVEEGYLFKVGLSIHAGRSHMTMLKKSKKAQEINAQTSKVSSKRSLKNNDPPLSSKKKKKSIIQDPIKEACDHIYAVEVKELERQCIEECIIRGFFKGI
ncbi:hypothetical protein IEQ34_016539 [Dendrobium chrysotoxum]|uniref:Uncharacterized protein n=1 Tax=Dendrobium chrysotoxum TaxID=161865 RepID=A0AAV7GEF0_DENCH|nr:hypothetical protein IEQ34_016539 [Dendrobium chrysotoxum]